MKGIVAEIKGKYAVILTQDGLFKKVRALPGMTVGMETELGLVQGDAGSRRFAARVASMAAVGLLVLGVGFGAYSYTVPYSYVDIDINPSIELTVNIYDRIIGAEALNEDGGKLLMDKDLRHKKLDNGVRELLNRAVEQGYLEAGAEIADNTVAQGEDSQSDGNDGNVSGDGSQASGGGHSRPENDSQSGSDNGSQASGTGVQDPGNTYLPSGEKKDPPEAAAPHGDGSDTQGGTAEPGGEPVIKNAVMVTVSSSNSKKSGELKKKIASTASKELDKDKVSSEILVGEASNEQREAARKLGVTPGKLALIEDVLKHLPEKELDDVKNSAVKELIEIARRNTKAVQSDKGAPGKDDGSNDNDGKGNKNKSGDNNSKIGNNSSNDNSSKSGNSSKSNNSKSGNSSNDKNSNKNTGKNDYPDNSRKNAGNNEKNAAPGKNNKDDKGGSQIIQGKKSSSGDANWQDGKTDSSRNKNDTNNNGGKSSSKDRKENQNEKKYEINVREILEKSSDHLRKEREKLKDEFLRQIENSQYESNKDRTGQVGDKHKDEDKHSKNNKDDKGKNQSSKEKGGTGNSSRSKGGSRK